MHARMETMPRIYSWVRRTRTPLFDHLSGLPEGLYTQPTEILSGDSIRDRHVHMATCYLHWILRIGLGETLPVSGEPPDYPSPTAVRALFDQVDQAVDRLIHVAGEHTDEPMSRTANGEKIVVTPRWILTHTITHEFHHKGQIVLVLRLFGHPMGDSDLALPHPLEWERV